MWKRTLGLVTLTLGVACGDIGMLELDVQFPDQDTEEQTRALHVFIRDVPADRDGCADLFGSTQTTLPQIDNLVEYPNRSDIVAGAVDLGKYEELTILVYALPTLDTPAEQSIAAGCVKTTVSGTESTEATVPLELRP